MKKIMFSKKVIVYMALACLFIVGCEKTPPIANFSVTPTKGMAPLEVSFTDQSTPRSHPITSWEWHFGDGDKGISKEQNPIYIYRTPGIYTVSLTVNSRAGQCTETMENIITVCDNVQLSLDLSPDMIFVPSGTFVMGARYGKSIYEGSNEYLDEGSLIIWDGMKYCCAEYGTPAHNVTLSAYEIGKFEVTNAQFAAVLTWALFQGYMEDVSGNQYDGGDVYYGHKILLQLAPYTLPYQYSAITYEGCGFNIESREGYSMEDHPVVNVTWYGAVAFCNWLSEMNGLTPCYNLNTWKRLDPVPNGYRLPTEAEWERAAAWDPTANPSHWNYSFCSDEISFARCNYYDEYNDVYANPLGLSSMPFTSPVGYYNGLNGTINSQSPVGCYDMSGNVSEWVHDYYGFYSTEDQVDPSGPDKPTGDAPGGEAVLRGGCCHSYHNSCFSSTRYFCMDRISNGGRNTDGLRVARNAE